MDARTEESAIRKEFGDHECPTCGTQCADAEDLYTANQAELTALREENARLLESWNAANRIDAALSPSPAQQEQK